MIDIQDLSTQPVHPTKSTFKNYSKLKIADALGISPGYLTNILNGACKPSNDLNQKIIKFAADVIAAERI